MTDSVSNSIRPGQRPFDVALIRRDFPTLEQRPHGGPRVYLDNAATALTPRVVIDRVAGAHAEERDNLQRGVQWLSERAAAACDNARAMVRQFLNAANSREIVFLSGTTEALDLVAQVYGRAHIGRGDEVVLSIMEHQANSVPWQMLCANNGARVRIIPMNDAGELDLDAYQRLLSDRTKMVAVAHVSNVLGTINPVTEMVRLARPRNIPVIVDGAQAVAHMPVDVQALGCDFYACSAHKMFGPTGIGVLYARSSRLDPMPDRSGEPLPGPAGAPGHFPSPFAAHTPTVADAVGLAAAIGYLGGIGLDAIAAYERELLVYATEALSRVPGIRLIGAAKERAGILSFLLEGSQPHDIGTILEREGIAIRSGDHRCRPLMQRLGVTATARASLAFHNTRDDIDALAAALGRVRKMSG